MVCIIEYVIIADSAISCDFVRSATECEFAANKLGLADVIVEDDVRNDSPYWVDLNPPPFCYFEGGRLKFNIGTNSGPCTTSKQCLCRQNDFCAKIPCGEGQGDCDDDNECEGSLVCGHRNCMNTTITDCCTQPCSNDNECTSGDCNLRYNQCYLWSDCSQDAPCADGEGHCDTHTDCDGALLCGNDNCWIGSTSMDCCTGRYMNNRILRN